MEGSSSSVPIDRKSSTETESRTLNIDTLMLEAALYVMSTKSIEEAMNVFMEGLDSAEEENGTRQNNTRMDSAGEEEDDHCLEDQPQVLALRDIASVPL